MVSAMRRADGGPSLGRIWRVPMIRRTGAVGGLVAASHPGPTVVVTALSVTLLIGLGTPTTTVVLAAAAVLAGQLSVGWSNDWIDADRDIAVGRADKPIVAGLVTPATLRTVAVVAACGCAVLSWSVGLLAGTVHVVAVASAWAYNLLLKRTVFSPLPYALSFGLLPVFLVLAAGRSVPGWLAAAGALLGAGAHVANVLPDMEDDVVTAVRGLPHRIGRRASTILAPVLLVAATLVVTAGPGGVGGLRGAAAGVAVVLAAGSGVVGGLRPRSRLPFILSMTVAGVCVLLLATAGGSVRG